MKNKLSIITSGIVLAFMATGSQSHAANVVWNSVQTPSADSDVSTTGTYVGSYVSTPAAGVVVNGVTFTNTFTGGITVGDNGWGYATWPNYAAAAPLSANYKLLLNGASEQITTLTLSNLTINQQYLIQIWAADYRDGIPSRQQTITGGSNTSGVLSWGNNGSPGGSFVIGTFTANSTTQLFTFATANATGTNINAMQLRAIPEPSAALLGSLGMLALLRRRREG
jgi:hypothetical protein